MQQFIQAPELRISRWFNSDQAITLKNLRGRVVVLEAFQMLCPGCVSHGLPQAQKIARLFPPERVMVLGLHTVFEHHDAMTPVSLEAFIHEYRLSFPIGVDEAGDGPLPRTMEAYGMRGTPSLILIDQEGRQRANHFGAVDDMTVGAEIATLLAEGKILRSAAAEGEDGPDTCDETGCPAPETS